MSASFPATVKSFTTKTDSVDFVHASHIDDLQDEVTAIEQDLINGLARIRASSSTLSLAADAMTVTKSLHAVDTEAAAATDNLATINAGAGVGAGHLLILYAANIGRVVTVKDGAGNIALAGGDFALDSAKKSMLLRYDGAVWVEIAAGRSFGLPSIAGITDGQILIGKTSDHTLNLAALTAGAGLSVANGAGSITLASVRPLNAALTEQVVTNTAVNTSVYSFAIPANTLVAGKALRVRLTGGVINTSGGTVNLTITLKIGATTIIVGVQGVGTGTNPGVVEFACTINANNSANSQRAVGSYVTTGVAADGAMTSSVTSSVGGHSSLAIDMTTSQTMDISVQWASAAATITFKKFGVMLEQPF